MREDYTGGFIKLFRKMLSWEWYTDIPTKVLFLHLLLSVNWESKRYKGVDIPAGSLTTSVKQLSKQTGLTVMQVRTALEHLKSTHEIPSKTTNKYTLITIEKWENFQSDELRYDTMVSKLHNNQVTIKQQTDNKQVATNEEYKNIKELKESKNSGDAVKEKWDEFLFVNKDKSIPYEIALKCENISRECNGMELL